MNKNLIEHLKWRGMLHDITPHTEAFLLKGMASGYIGFDATAPSLHIGNLCSIMLLKHFQISGHKPYIVIGGATTMVGDPGGKKEERKLIPEEKIRYNQERIKQQLVKFLDFQCKPNAAEILNNYDWHKKINFLAFLREVGKHIPVSYMLGKESVKRRLEIGLSFAEFSYQLLQGYDFYHLFKEKNVSMQMGGSDQWGNLTTGIELIRRKIGGSAYAATSPLVTKSDGTKFGKTESGAVWLDAKMTSPYKFYQFWINCTDQDCEKYVKIFSLKQKDDILSLVERHKKEPHKRILQKALAKELTVRVHSQNDCDNATKASEVLFSKDKSHTLDMLSEDIFLEIFEGVPKIKVSKSEIKNNDIIDFLTASTNNVIFISKADLRRSIKGGGVCINKEKLQENNSLGDFHFIKNKYLVVQKGKKNYYLVVIE